jgi:hypothetical protein
MKNILLIIIFVTTSLASAAEKKNVLLIAGLPSHGPGAHEHNAGIQLFAEGLKQAVPDLVNVEFTLNGQWPTDKQIDAADTIVIYSDGGKNHPALGHLEQLTLKMAKGCGFVCIHYAIEPAYERAGWPSVNGEPVNPPPPERFSTGKGTPEFKEWLGGYFEQYFSVNPHWFADFKTLPEHPISRGVAPFSSNDEWYFHMRFKDKMEGITPLLVSTVPPEKIKKTDSDHGGNPDVRREVLEEKKPQIVAWAVTRNDGGRGFGFCGGHFHSGWANDNQRKLVLNAILWTAKAEVPAQGVVTVFSEEQLKANQDKKSQPSNLNEIKK